MRDSAHLYTQFRISISSPVFSAGDPHLSCNVTGKKVIKLEVCTGQNSKAGKVRATKRSMSTGLEVKLDELRKELSSSQGGIFPHAVLSTQQISLLSAQKPTSMDQVSVIFYFDNPTLY